jgi:peptidoglycan LD-endopeptidase CwlK
MEKPLTQKTLFFIGGCVFLNFCLGAIDYRETLMQFYGENFTLIDNNHIRWEDGEISILDDGEKKNAAERIDQADIEDQFSMVYPMGKLTDAPMGEENDPGRIRNDLFFRKLYGANKEEVEKNLKELEWMPSHTDSILLFNTKNGAWDSLKRVSEELDKLDESLLNYVTVTAGTYCWRTIKDTERLSAHSFGIAIDINVKYSSYWKWDETYQYKNQIPYEIVEIFEQNGFIWGGKWYHYDTMHFEYRPELLQ